jgi:hypothetical protein
MRFGFSVKEGKISKIAKVAYHGLYQYLRSFMDALSDSANAEIEKTCLEIFNESEKRSIFDKKQDIYSLFAKNFNSSSHN